MKNYIDGEFILASAKRILVVSNEPWADYHSAPIAEYYKSIPVIHIIPDTSLPSRVEYNCSQRSLPVSCVREDPDDVLIIAGSGEWPLKVRRCFPKMKAIAVRLAYLTPNAPKEDLGIVTLWAENKKHSVELSEHFSISHDEILIEPYPWKIELPVWMPEGKEILLVTSVTNNDIDGGSAGNANSVLLEIAKSLRYNAINFSISLHPREPVDRWEEFDITSEGTLFSASKSCLVIAVTGTVIESIYQMAVPLALIPVPIAPAHLYQYGQSIHTVNDAMEFVAAIIPESLLVPQ